MNLIVDKTTGLDEKWLIAAVDVGGTFTDTIAISKDHIKIIKVPSTPHNPLNAVLSSVQQLIFVPEVLHSTTVSTNAVLERKGAKVVLITTKGFADILEIGRQNREDIYALYPTRPQPLVPGNFRFEVNERIVSDGTVETELTEQEINNIKSIILQNNPESIAICTLFSFINPIHEKKLSKVLSNIAPISLSSEVLPEYREYERTSTTVMDAYVKPLMANYLHELDNKLLNTGLSHRFAVLKSARGLARGRTIAKYPVNTLFSGLAGGLLAGEFTAKLLSLSRLISLDIGGTSTDVASIIDSKGGINQSHNISGLPVAIPAVDVETIGAGGGSMIQLESGLLKVGPKSAGAIPGPMAYGLGGDIPTITDADLVFGILPPLLAGGELNVKKKYSLSGLTQLSKDLGISLDDTITGVRMIFHENIASAIRSVSTERGLDPRTFHLLAFGGAGPVHTVELAALMGISKVIVPPFPGVWSAMGLLGADYNYESSIGKVIEWKLISKDEIQDLYRKLIDNVNQQADEDDHGGNRQIHQELSMRFKGQSFDLLIPYSKDKKQVSSAFINLHKQRYGFAAEHEPLELVALRVSLIIPHDEPVIPIISEKEFPNPTEYRKIIGYDDNVPVYNKLELGRNAKLSGPVVIDQQDTTTWIPENWSALINKFGFIMLEKM